MTSNPSPSETTTPAEETPVAASPRPARGRPRVPHVSSLFNGPCEGLSPPAAPGPMAGPGPSANGWPRDEQPEPNDRDPRRAGADRGKSSKPSPISRKQLRQGIADSLQGASQLANTNLTRDELEEMAGLYVMSEEQAKMIGDPAGNITARRLAAAGIGGSPDIADVLTIIAGFAVYALQQLALRGALRRHRRAMAASTVQVELEQPGPEPQL